MSGVGSDPLEARLSEALRSGLADSPVDAPSLLDGAHRRVRRVRQRRMAAGAAAVALVLAVPVGYEIVHPETTKYGTQAAMIPGRSPSPLATLPDSLAFRSAELPAGVRRDLSLVSERVPVVSGQQCADSPGPRPVTGRQWNWSSGDTNAASVAVNLTVTRWADASSAFTELVADTGLCRWTDAPTSHAFTARGAAASWAGTSEFSTLHYGRAVVRVGNLLAGVEVQSPAGTQAALTTAEQLAEALTPRLKRAS
jgi:hypothetical protein